MSDNVKIESVNKIFIASTKDISSNDLQKYLYERLSRDGKVFPKGTIFYLLTGIHHNREGKLGETDTTLNEDFHYTVFNNLANYCGNLDCQECKGLLVKPCSSGSIWKEMDYRDRVVPLYALPAETDYIEKENEAYVLSRKSEIDLENLCQDLMTENRPTALIFASCYSMYSTVTDILRSNGVIATMNLSKDMSEATEGKVLCLDDQQKEIITQVKSVSS